MKSDFWFGQVPLLGVFLLTAVVILLSIGIGTLWGGRRRSQPDHEAETPLGTIIGSTLGLLAFMLGFTYSIAANFVQTRRDLFLDEINAISTVYLQSQLLDEAYRSELSNLIREYVNIRVELMDADVSDIHKAVARSDSIQDEIWKNAFALIKSDIYPEMNALFISSLNKMFDLQTSRVVAFRYRIPAIIWYALYFITILSMITVGFQVGLSGKSMFKMGIVLMLTFSTVMLLIADLDRPLEGYFQVDKRPIFNLQKKIQAATQQKNENLEHKQNSIKKNN
ncbi:MAG: hypothetical protein ABFD79_13860 [Phycisphaerales bacterium]